MVLSIEVPDAYPYVMFMATAVPYIANTILGVAVMNARKQFDVQYPNLYATPGYHKNADEFNRVQRGHQNSFEQLPHVIVMTLVGGLVYPISSCIANLAYCVGSVLYQNGYADTKLDVKSARYKKGGAIKMVGMMGSFFLSIAACYSLKK